MSKKTLRSTAILLTLFTFCTNNLGAANFMLMGPPPAATHLMPRPPIAPAALPAPKPAPREPLYRLPDVLAPFKRAYACARSAAAAFFAPLPQEAVNVVPPARLPMPAEPKPASRPEAAVSAKTETMGIALPVAPRMGDLLIDWEEKSLFGPMPAPDRIPPPAVTPTKRRAIRRLALTGSFMPITQRGERVAGFQPMRLHWEKSYAEGLAPASPYKLNINTGWENVADVRQIGYEGSKPLGERTIYEVTYKDGTKGVIRASPLVFDLSGHGVDTSGRVVLYDIKGSGRADKLKRINDIGAGTGALVFDADRDGKSGEGGHELFGDSTDLDGDGRPEGWADGFVALRALVEKAAREGVLSSHILVQGRLDAKALASLEKAYGLGMKVGGLNSEPVSLAEAGVTAVWFSMNPATRHRNFDGDGNDVSRQHGAVFTRADGTVGAYSDIWFAHK